MAATDAATIASASAPDTPAAPAVRPPLSSALLLCRFWTVAALLLAAGSFPQSSFFTVSDIRVEGARRIASADVLALSGLALGMPVLGIVPDEVARRVAALPGISSVAVGLTTGGTITIRITERAPAAAVRVDEGFAIVDQSGVVIATQTNVGALPVIAVDRSDLPWVREGTELPSAAVPDALDALVQLPASLPRAGLILQRSATGEMSVTTPDRIVVRLGPVAGLRERAAMLPQILATVRAQRLALNYIDLRFASTVILKPAPGAGSIDGAGDGP